MNKLNIITCVSVLCQLPDTSSIENVDALKIAMSLQMPQIIYVGAVTEVAECNLKSCSSFRFYNNMNQKLILDFIVKSTSDVSLI